MNRDELLRRIELDVLPRALRPARYAGGEWNAVHKDWDTADVRMALAFPDTYEVGMSNLGFLLLYHLVNERPWALCERVFAPWADTEALLRAAGAPVFSIESRRPLAEFDVVGFSLAYELSYTNVLTLLDLSGLPFRAAERGPDAPLVIAGGCAACNPEPVAEVFDLVFLGEAEEALVEMLSAVREMKRAGATREERVREIAKIPGFYAPALYRARAAADGTPEIEPAEPGAPCPIARRYVKDLDASYYPDRLVLPATQAIHDRVHLEILRGCVRGCRFCQAGVIYRPRRERSPEKLAAAAKSLCRASGCEEISLLSLNTADYSRLPELLQGLDGWTARDRISVSLPSTRLDKFSDELARGIRAVRPTGLTFAPEAGSQRLRDAVGKNISEEEIFAGVLAGVRNRTQKVKLYFMIGLPTETEADVRGIADLIGRLRTASREAGRAEFNVSVSNFVPKPHTPFQWLPMEERESLRGKQRMLRKAASWKNVKLKMHSIETSFLESVFARGDRRLLPALEEAWRRGARFDGWSECFNIERWIDAFAASGIDPLAFAHRRFDPGAPLPWSHIHAGINESYLKSEMEKALAAAESALEE